MLSLQTITVIVQESFPQGKKTNLQFMLRSYYTPDDIDSGKLKVSQMDKHIMHLTHLRLL